MENQNKINDIEYTAVYAGWPHKSLDISELQSSDEW